MKGCGADYETALGTQQCSARNIKASPLTSPQATAAAVIRNDNSLDTMWSAPLADFLGAEGAGLLVGVSGSQNSPKYQKEMHDHHNRKGYVKNTGMSFLSMEVFNQSLGDDFESACGNL